MGDQRKSPTLVAETVQGGGQFCRVLSMQAGIKEKFASTIRARRQAVSAPYHQRLATCSNQGVAAVNHGPLAGSQKFEVSPQAVRLALFPQRPDACSYGQSRGA
jgi:predicted methyltransferase